MMEIPLQVLVEWVDTQTTLGWTASHEQAQPCVNYTNGFMTFEDDKVIKVSHTWNENSEADITVIPKGVISNIWVVEIKRKRKVYVE